MPLLGRNQLAITLHISIHVAVPSPPPPPEEKWDGGNIYKELARIVLCDVEVIYVSLM